MSEAARARVIRAFIARFGAPPAFIARAPGRVNLIGDHTDYNEGFVLPMAIDRAAWIAFRARDDTRVSVHSLDFDETAAFDIVDADQRGHGWQEYIRGVGWALSDAEATSRSLRGWEGVVGSDVPVGAGLSSSAALELAAARAFTAAARLPWDATTMARVAQRAENEWVGVRCGIMDQLISAAGKPDHALLIDCRSLHTRSVPLPAEARVVVLDTATRRGIVDSAYNERRAQCEAAARFFGVGALRDAELATFDARAAGLDALIRRRARHVVTENARTVAAAAALARGDLATVGALMNESHASLRDDFEVSRPELDVVVEIAQEHAGCHGARMTGAGFGGCAVALVSESSTADFADSVVSEYAAKTGLTPAVYVCRAAGGASLASG